MYLIFFIGFCSDALINDGFAGRVDDADEGQPRMHKGKRRVHLPYNSRVGGESVRRCSSSTGWCEMGLGMRIRRIPGIRTGTTHWVDRAGPAGPRAGRSMRAPCHFLTPLDCSIDRSKNTYYIHTRFWNCSYTSFRLHETRDFRSSCNTYISANPMLKRRFGRVGGNRLFGLSFPYMITERLQNENL